MRLRSGSICLMVRTDQVSEDSLMVGQAIRKRRKARSLTLVDLAEQVDLSQPFLSQIENGRARPSLMSLHRIAEALDTTPQAFFGETTDFDAQPSVVRAKDVRHIQVNTEQAESVCRVLVAGRAPFHVLEFDGLPKEFLDYFTHDGFEAVFVVAGRIEIDIDGTVTALGRGDSISYPSRMPHRLRSVGKRRAQVFLVETQSKTEMTREWSESRDDPHRQCRTSHTPSDDDASSRA